MRKLILVSLALCIGCIAIAQKPFNVPAQLLSKPEKMMQDLKGDEMPVIINESNPFLTTSTSRDLGTKIGITYYDLQSNANNGNRMTVFANGTIAAVWTMAPTAVFTVRGSGFNQSSNGGTTWLPDPTATIEGTVRTGWPNIGKESNGTIVDVSHADYTGNICRSTDNGVNWENITIGSTQLELSWPRMVTNGNTIHIIFNTKTNVPFQGFLQGALVYMRSTDNGDNWTDPIIPTGLDTSNYAASSPFTDGYSIANKGDTIVIAYGDIFRTPCLVKSTNNGQTWSYKEILHLPIKKFDTEGTKIYDINGDSQEDNCYGNDGCNFVILDKFGKAHVFFGRMNGTDDGAGAGYNYYPYTDGLYYWNEDMGTIQYQYRWTMIGSTNTYEGIPDTVNFPIITEVYDIDHSGQIEFPDNGSNIPFGPYYCSLSSQPNAVVLPDGTIYLYYSSIVENTDGTVGSEHRAFRNVWMVKKGSGQTSNFTWSTPIRIAEDDFTEQVWPCVAPTVTGTAPNFKAHLWYQGDGYPGNSLQPSSGNPHPIVENTIYYKNLSVVPEGFSELSNGKSAPVIYPNPASNNVTVSYKLASSANITLRIYNFIGQQIIQTTQNNAIGDVNVTLNIETLPQGIYFIKSDIGEQTYTNKLVIR
jgi:hypothetical protein